LPRSYYKYPLESIGSKSVVTNASVLSLTPRAHYQQLTLYQYHLATMISQRVIVLSALVALFALLSTADAQQQLRANNKRVLLEQEVSRVDIEPSRADVSVCLGWELS